LPEVDAVTIAVPNYLHAPICLEAMRSGKAVLVEKPLCLTADELIQLEETYRLSPVPLKVGFRLRWNPSLRALRMRLHGARRVRCIYRLGIEKLAAGKEWTRRQSESGGAFFTLGIHALDLARWLVDAQGEPFSHLRAHAATLEASADFPLEVSLSGNLLNDTQIVAGADLRGDGPFRLDLEVQAEKGSFPDPSLPSPGSEEEHAAEFEYEGLITDFIHAACRGEPNLSEVLEYFQSHHALIQSREIAVSGGRSVWTNMRRGIQGLSRTE
jgi:predicted dehydrogenase